jgi:endonuclease YncB( thermonuclease family)
MSIMMNDAKPHTACRVASRLLVLLLASQTAFSAEMLHGHIVGVADGDTVTLLDDTNTRIKVRLHQIDAPEKRQDFGQRSKQSLSDLVFGKEVDVEVVTVDKYGRSVGRILVGGQDANLEQVRRGMAWVYKKYADEPAYFEAEQAAKASGKGLWSQSNPTEPWVFRHASRERGSAKASSSASFFQPPASQLSGFVCGAKRYCSEMSSREEAQHYLNDCGFAQLDRDGDGVACERL